MNPITVMNEIAPEALDLVEQRYLILRTVYFMAPVGRRAIAQRLEKSERTIRKEVDVLRERGFLIGNYAGMSLSSDGERILTDLREYIRQMHGLTHLEQELKEVLKVKKVIIVPGDSDQDMVVKQDLAKATARYLRQVLKNGDVLAVTGGTTLSQVAASFPSDGTKRDVIVVPARGGLGEDVTIQANSIAAKLAQGLGGSYRLLHAPDNVDSNLVSTIVADPQIRDVITLVRRANVLLHGIGTAEEMASRRGLDEEHVMQLIIDGAVGEAFGYYFDPKGQIVYATSSLGVRLEDLGKIPLIVAVGGGKSKAWAVLSVVSTGYCDVCITDEGGARRLMSLLKHKEEHVNGN